MSFPDLSKAIPMPDIDMSRISGILGRAISESQIEAIRAVGQRVTAQLAVAISLNERFSVPDPDLVASVIADLVVSRTPDADGSALAEAVAPLWTAEKARAALGLSRSAMQQRRETGSLLGLRTTEGNFFYPVAQFERHGDKTRVKPALRTFLMTLRDHDPWTVAVTLNGPADELDGLTPLEWVRKRGAADRLKDYAEVLDAEWSR